MQYVISMIFVSEPPARRYPRTVNESFQLVSNKTDSTMEMKPNSSTMETMSKNGHELETYLVPSLMSCPIFVSFYIIYKLYKKVRMLNQQNNVGGIHIPMLRLEPFETDL